MLKVDIIYGNYLTNKIGPSTNLKRLLSNKVLFKKQDIEFELFSLDKDNYRKTTSNGIDVKTSLFNKLINRFFSFIKLNHTEAGSKLLIYLKYIRHSDAVIKKYCKANRQADIVVFDEFFTCLNYLKHKKENQKIVLFHHGNGDYFKMFEIYMPGLVNSNYLKKLNQQFEELVAQINALIFVSEFGLQNFVYLRGNLFQHSGKYHKLYYGVEAIVKGKALEVPALKAPKDHLTLVCVGSVNERKGQFLVIDAYKRLTKEKKEKLTIHFLGSGTTELSRLMEDVERSGLKEHLIFHGGVSNPSLYLTHSDAFILTSFDEGLPISIIEAMSYGLPIFSTRIAGIPETIEENGILIEPIEEDVYKLLDTIHSLDLKSMSNESKRMFNEKFSYPAYINNYSKILKEL